MLQISRQIHQTISAAHKVIIIPHQHPDGDALGSAAAMKEYITALGKPVVIFCATPVAPRWQFMPHAQSVENDTAHFFDSDVDVIVVLDSGDLRYAGVSAHLANHRATIINIDHHATNEKYGALNLVVVGASSTAEIVHAFFRQINHHVNKIQATALLTGIITDTDNFTNSATTQSAMLAASELLRAGGNLKLVIKNTVKNKTMAAFKLWGMALSRLTHHEPTGIAHTYITQTDLLESGASDTEAEGIANFLNNLDGSAAMLILKETADGQIKGSFRTTCDDVDVAAWAKKLGGGGHKKAAGFTLSGAMAEVLERVLQK